MERSPDPSAASSPWRTAGRVLSFVVAVPLGLIALVLVVLGGIFIWQTDYSDHTGRAEAVVSAVEESPEADDDGSTSYNDVLVDYAAEGREFTSVRLDGQNLDSYREGDRLTVAYDPAEPGNPVTVRSTDEDSPGLFMWLGTGMLAVGGLAGIVAIALPWLALRGIFRRRTTV